MEYHRLQAAKSHYVLYEDRTDDRTVVASSFQYATKWKLDFNAGGSFRKLESHNYQHVLDLLGGAYLRILMVL
jgi:hypothetical protein